MKRRLNGAAVMLTCLLGGVATAATLAQPDANGRRLTEQSMPVAMPPGFSVVATSLEGPVFADAQGHTLYTWPAKRLRNGYAGETQGNIQCYGEVKRVSAGLMSPYPPGLLLPELDSRPGCTDLWTPVLAAEDAKAVGKWTVLDRTDGSKQWAYDEQALYTSVLDRKAGDTLGGTTRRSGGDSPAIRVPAGPPSLVPPGFKVKTTTLGRMLTTDKNFSVYAFDQDTPERSACDEVCTRTWPPVLAPMTARAQGEWQFIERSPGVRQWTFRGRPLYTYVQEVQNWRMQGSDIPGWHNVFTQVAPPPPAEFTVQDTLAGQVLADERGRTIYIYTCGDDSEDQLSCEHPSDTQVYRLAMCGGGDWRKCQTFWPYVPAQPGTTSQNQLWTVVSIDPQTGRFATEGQAGAVSVWAYRDRPVYTYGLDQQPGDVHGAGTGEWRGQRNGLKAFWVRDDFFGGIL